MKSPSTKLLVVILALAVSALAQSVTKSDTQKADAKDAAKSEAKSAPETQKPLTEAQKTFAVLKTLAGSWEGVISGVAGDPSAEGKTAHMVLRQTSMGNALLHEMKVGERPDDPITMIYLDEGRLLLTHYCDAGNRPRMVGKVSADGKRVEFEFLDIAGNAHFHMHSAVFTLIDENHHTEDWTFMIGDKMARPHFDFVRSKTVASIATQPK
jgi:hypothetical protein